MKILFLHGWHSVPGGVKPTYLKDHGHTVINPALDDDDFEAAVRSAQEAFDKHQPKVVVGSSRGGAVAMNIQSHRTPLVLLCPAWKNWGNAMTLKANSVILHSRHDDVIPYADSEELVASSRLPPETLIEVGNDHRLADPEPLSVLLWACNLLAEGVNPASVDSSYPPTASFSSRSKSTTLTEASYICDACGEEIVIPLDVSQGSSQTYVEDCPVCCRANNIHVQIDDSGEVQVWADPEQDYD
jgi:hypothetical protein